MIFRTPSDCFIQLLHINENKQRNFGSKVQAIHRGEKLLQNIEFDFIGNLDADISFDPTYFESILKKFQQNKKLGIAGGFILEKYNGQFKKRSSNSVRSVAGAVQFFRRECYESIGGYTKINYGIDWYANVMARKNDWQVETFPELKVYHHRHTAKFEGNVLCNNFRTGKRDFSFGSHPLFEAFKCFRRIKEKPYVIGSFLRMAGFIWSYVIREDSVVSKEFVTYLQKEQTDRLKSVFLFRKKF